MAECRSSEPTPDQYGSDDITADISNWTNSQDSDSHKIRSDIISTIINKCTTTGSQSLAHLRTILDSGWDASEILDLQDNFHIGRIRRYALLEAAVIRGWTEGVNILLEAGAEWTSEEFQNPLALAQQNRDCPSDLIKLLLKHGADPNDHDDQLKNIPLLNAINNSSYHKTKVINNSSCHMTSTITVQLLLEHGANPNVTYGHWSKLKLPETYRESKWIHKTALQEAASQWLTDVVKILLVAGAKCTTSDAQQNPLMLAVQSPDCPPELIKLLLKHGADPNDHDSQLENIPLLNAIRCSRQREDDRMIVQLLLKHGANPNVSHKINIAEHGEAKWVQRTLLQEAAKQGWTDGVKTLLDAGAKCTTTDATQNPVVLALEFNCYSGYYQDQTDTIKLPLDAGAECTTSDALPNLLMLALQNGKCHLDLIELLLKHGVDVNYTVTGELPLLHRLSQYTFDEDPLFLQRHLDLFFLHGGNINMKGGGTHGTALEYATREDGHSNTVRWLIRHGADTALKFTLLNKHFMLELDSLFPDTPLILLQAGMRVPHGAYTQLSNIEAAISTWMEDDTEGGGDGWRWISRRIKRLWGQLEEMELQMKQLKFKTSIIPEHWTQQMVDLQEFSDESLHVYPEVTCLSSTGDIEQEYQSLKNVLKFLSQPQSLQWYCRRCVRENLVSLQPSVVKTLPGPSRLKRYILCHEI